ncbi:MAG: hypothetical protein WAR00_02395, partial [bacterium]
RKAFCSTSYYYTAPGIILQYHFSPPPRQLLFIILHYFVYICNTLFPLFPAKFFSPAPKSDPFFSYQPDPVLEKEMGFPGSVPLWGTTYPQTLPHFWHKCCIGALWMEENVDNVDNSVNNCRHGVLPGDSLWMSFFANFAVIEF